LLLERVILKGNLKNILADELEPQQLTKIYRSYDIVGDIAVIRVPETLEQHSSLIAEAILNTHREVKAVWKQTSSVSGDYRLRQLNFLSGDRRTETVHREYGCVFKVDLKKAYFSPRLSFERQRITQLVQPLEIVLNMFAGVGCYSISIAKHSEPMKVFSVDINPDAIRFLNENIRLNKVAETVVPILGDAKEVVGTNLLEAVDRVLMPLPEKAYNYLAPALSALKPERGWIHYYAFQHARKSENPVNKVEAKVSEKLRRLGVSFRVEFGRVVRPIGPRWSQVVLDIQVTD
jgi:tRNA (guanine37-N1)-methyltransferase